MSPRSEIGWPLVISDLDRVTFRSLVCPMGVVFGMDLLEGSAARNLKAYPS